MLCYAMLCYVCYVMLCKVVLLYLMLCVLFPQTNLKVYNDVSIQFNVVVKYHNIVFEAVGQIYLISFAK